MSETSPLAAAVGGLSEPAQDQRQPTELTPRKIRERWERSQRATLMIREQAAINEQFILNRHWLRWNRSVHRLEEMPRNPDRVRVTVNRLGPDSHRLLSKLTSRELHWEVPPKSADDAAIQSSRVAEQALFDTAREQGWEDIRYDHALDTWQGGVAGVMVEWDDQQGTIVAMEGERGIGTGNVKLTVIPLPEMAFEPGTRDGERSRWWIHARALPPAEVQDMYDLPDEPKPDAQAIDQVHRLHRNQTGASHTPLTMVLTIYCRPTNTKPGEIVTVVGNEIVDESDWYFPFTDRLNIALCRVQPISGKWYGHTPVSDAVPVQTAMNASWSSIIEHLKLAGNARLWVPEGSVEDVNDLSDMAGEAVTYNPINGMRPGYDAPPVMPEWWIRSPGELGAALDDILGQHDISRGIAPTGVESGIALSQLAENDDTPIGRFTKNMAGMWGRVGSMCLQLFEAYVRDTRSARIRMPNNRIPEVVQWNGHLLNGHTTAIVPLDSVTPRNRNAQAAYAFQLNDRGIVTNPVELAKIADLPDQDSLLEGIDPDTARAMRENSHMAAGAARTVDTIDDHQNHLIHHRNFMRSERYEQLPQEIQQMIRLHMAAHEQYAAIQAAQVGMAASVSPMAAALPTEMVNPLDPSQVAEAAMFSELAPSAATAGAGVEGAMPLTEQQLGQGPPPPPTGPPPSQPGPAMAPQEQAEQDLLRQQPPL